MIPIKERFPKDTIIYIAGAGAGKTTALIKEFDKAMELYRLDEIAFVSFTRKAAGEAIERLIKLQAEKGKVCVKEDFPYVKTLHSLCYAGLNIEDASFITDKWMKEFEKKTGIKILLSNKNMQKSVLKTSAGYFRVDTMERITGIFKSDNVINLREYTEFRELYKLFKQTNNLIDYEDCLELFQHQQNKLNNIKFLIIDEAQDLTQQQWNICFTAFPNAKSVRIAGDDWQSIFKFVGAEPQILLDLVNSHTVVKLEKTYRFSKQIADLSNNIMNLVKNKVEKIMYPSDDKTSSVHVISRKEDVIQYLRQMKGTTYCLFRSKSYADKLATELRRNGVWFNYYNDYALPYKFLSKYFKYKTKMYQFRDPDDWIGFCKKYNIKPLDKPRKEVYWKTGEEYLTTFPTWYNSGIFYEKDIEEAYTYLHNYSDKEIYDLMKSSPTILVTTTFRVKGGEADNVIVDLSLPDIVNDEIKEIFEDEVKVLYTAITRTKTNLFFILPQSAYSFYPLINKYIESAIGENK